MKQFLFIFLLLCFSLFIGISQAQTTEKSSQIAEKNEPKTHYKQKIQTLLDTQVFPNRSQSELNNFSKQLKNIDLKNIKNSLKKDIITSFQTAFEQKYKQTFGKPSPINMVLDLPNGEVYIPTLMFHYIEDVPATSSDQVRYGLSFSPERFEKLLQYLEKNNIETLTFFDIKDIFEGKKSMPERAVILTFDDGHLDHYTAAFPLLEKYGYKGVFYIISSKPDNNWNYMSWDHINKLVASGHEIGAHSVTHPYLTALSTPKQIQEIIQSKKDIEANSNAEIISFAYPFGANNKNIRKVVANNYLFARTTTDGNHFHSYDLFNISTIHMTPEFSLETLVEVFEYGKFH